MVPSPGQSATKDSSKAAGYELPTDQRQVDSTASKQEAVQHPITVIVPGANPDQWKYERDNAAAQLATQKRMLLVTWVLALFQLMTAIGGLIWTRNAANAAKVSADAAKASTEIAQRALVLTERADLHPVNWTVTDLAVTKVPRVAFDIQNLGRTRAKLLTTETRALYATETPKANPVLTVENRNGIPIGATARVRHFLDVPRNDGAVAAIKAGREILFIYVRLTYHDVFGAERSVQTARYYSPHHGTFLTATEAAYEQSD